MCVVLLPCVHHAVFERLLTIMPVAACVLMLGLAYVTQRCLLTGKVY